MQQIKAYKDTLWKDSLTIDTVMERRYTHFLPDGELVQLQGGQLFGSQQLPLSEALAFLIQIVQRDAHLSLIHI